MVSFYYVNILAKYTKGKLLYKRDYELSARRLAVGTRTNSHDEVCRRLIGRVRDAVLFI